MVRGSDHVDPRCTSPAAPQSTIAPRCRATTALPRRVAIAENRRSDPPDPALHHLKRRLASPAALEPEDVSTISRPAVDQRSNTASIADFSWQFNDSTPGCTTTCNDTIETTVPTISHTFPASGLYSVGLAAFQSSGLSAGFGGIINTGKSGFVPGFTEKISGSEASFKCLNTISLQAVTNYLWEFGDGSTGSGAAPTHDYAKAGTYKVTVVEFSGIGSAYPGSGAAPIYSKTIRVG